MNLSPDNNVILIGVDANDGNKHVCTIILSSYVVNCYYITTNTWISSHDFDGVNAFLSADTTTSTRFVKLNMSNGEVVWNKMIPWGTSCYRNYNPVRINDDQTLGFAFFPYRNGSNFLIWITFNYTNGNVIGNRYKTPDGYLIPRELILNNLIVYVIFASSSININLITWYNSEVGEFESVIYYSTTHSIESVAVVNPINR